MVEQLEIVGFRNFFQTEAKITAGRFNRILQKKWNRPFTAPFKSL